MILQVWRKYFRHLVSLTNESSFGQNLGEKVSKVVMSGNMFWDNESLVSKCVNPFLTLINVFKLGSDHCIIGKD